MYYRAVKLITLLLIVLFATVACERDGDTSGVTDDEIVLGSWGPLTGPAALWGNVVHGMDAYFKMINEEGGIHGRQIRFVYRDDGYEPPRTVSAVRQMVQNENVFAFVGGVGTAPGMAVKNFIVENDIPWIAPVSGSTHWAYPPSENIFSMYPVYSDEAAVQVQYAVEELGAESIAIIYQNDDYGRGGLVGAEMMLEEYGMELAESVSVGIMDSDLSSHAARLSQADADVVLMWLLPRQAAIALGTTGVMGFNPTWIASSTLSDLGLMYDITDGNWEGVIYSGFGMMYDADVPTMRKYREAFSRFKPDVRWGTFAAAGFFFAEPLVEAMERAGPELSRETLIEALESLDHFEGTGVPVTFGPNQRQGTQSVYLVQVKEGADYEVLTDYVSAGIDIDEAIHRLRN